MLFRKSIISLAVVSCVSVPFMAQAVQSSDAYNTIHTYAPMAKTNPGLMNEINAVYPYLNDNDRSQAVAWIKTFNPDWTAPKTAAELAQEGAELTHMNIDRVQPQIDALSHAKEWKAPVAVHVPESEVEAVETPLNVEANPIVVSPTLREAQAHVERFAMRPVHNMDSAEHVAETAHNPLYAGTKEGEKAQFIMRVAAAKYMANRTQPEAAPVSAAPAPVSLRDQILAKRQDVLEQDNRDRTASQATALEAAQRKNQEFLHARVDELKNPVKREVVSYEKQVAQVNEQHYQALKAGDQESANALSKQAMDLAVAKDAADQNTFTPEGSQKVEAPENVAGSQFKRTMINAAERREAVAHEERYQGMTHPADVEQTPDPIAAAPALTADEVQANLTKARFNQLKKDSVQDAATATAQTTADSAAKTAGAALGNTSGNALRIDMLNKGLSDSIEEQAKTDSAQDGKIASASHFAGQALVNATNNGKRITGDELAQMNRDRTATQHVDAVEAAKRSIPTPTNGVDGKDGKNGVDGITTTITKVEVDQKTRDQVAATTKGMFANRTQINANTGEILSHSRAIASNRQAIENNSARIDGLNKNFASLKNEVSQNKKQASAGTSAAMAQANIPQVTDSQRFAMGAGMGGYDGENALAVGVSFHASQNVVVKATVSDDTENNIGYGAGVSVGW
ncbi:YadA C-terminal domain-containing protein [Salmonella enterica subsp. enterica]